MIGRRSAGIGHARLATGRTRRGEHEHGHIVGFGRADPAYSDWRWPMSFKSILVPIEHHDLMNSTLETTLLLARQFDSYIEGFALRVPIPAAFAIGDVGAVPIEALKQDIEESEKRSHSLFESFMREHGVPFGGDTKT